MYNNFVDYQTVATIAREHCGQMLSEANLSAMVKNEVRNQISEVIREEMDNNYREIKTHIEILNQQVKLLREAIEAIHSAQNNK